MVLFRLLIEVGGEVSYDRIEVLLIRNRKQIGVYVVFGAFTENGTRCGLLGNVILTSLGAVRFGLLELRSVAPSSGVVGVGVCCVCMPRGVYGRVLCVCAHT